VLIVTNGDCAAERIERIGLPAEVLSWGDVLHEGPVPAGLSPDELREVRARFLAGRGWAGLEETAENFARRDATLDSFGEHDEVVLWFEHDLYDQLQLVQILDRFEGRDLGTTRLTLVCADEYLGTLEPDRLRTMYRERREVSKEWLDLGREGWETFRSPDPTRILALLSRDMSALPFLAGALFRHLEQFPSTKNGLSRSEEQALEAVSDGATVLHEAFVASHQEREVPIFLADTVFASYLEDLSAAREPLVLLESGETIRTTRGDEDPTEYWGQRATVTATGRDVLRGAKDRIELNGIDRWLGGVHLDDANTWRWDGSARKLRRAV